MLQCYNNWMNIQQSYNVETSLWVSELDIEWRASHQSYLVAVEVQK